MHAWHQLDFMRECTFAEAPHRLCGATNDKRAGRHFIFLHGVSRYWRTFHTLLPALNDTYRISALDFRGHGRSARTPDRYLVTDYISDALTLLEALDARDAVVYGHSLGAMIAFAVAARAGDRVGAVILEDPPFSTMGSKLAGTPLGEYFRGMQQTVESSRDAEEHYQRFGNLIVGGRPLREQRDEASLRFAAEGFTMLDPTVFEPIVAGRWLDGYDFGGLRSKVRCPVLLLQADPQTGGMLTDSEASMLANDVPNCRLVRVANAPHLIHWTQPQRILELVTEFLR